ncbi:MAG: prepilin-type N-terminal cleavage/methylation domain-containing protein [Chitinispirillales bacterium]|nr:prepilin-type N-terminal cleavage/methylation domain-containing protein [Chitinispirillales bacterium]
MYQKVKKSEDGFTLVELLVAAVIILISVVAVVAVVRKSTDMQITDQHRRQVRAEMVRIFETHFSTFAPAGYTIEANGAVNTTVVFPDTTGGNIVADANVTGEGLTFQLVTPRREGDAIVNDELPVVFTVAGARGMTPLNLGMPAGPQDIIFHDITMTATWTERGGADDTIELTKRLAATP